MVTGHLSDCCSSCASLEHWSGQRGGVLVCGDRWRPHIKSALRVRCLLRRVHLGNGRAAKLPRVFPELSLHGGEALPGRSALFCQEVV